MSYLIQIEKRHAERCQTLKDSRQIKPPLIYDGKSVKEHNTVIKDLQADLLEQTFLIDQDVQILLSTLRQVATDQRVDLDRLVAHQWNLRPLDQETQDVLNRRMHDEQTAKDKADEKSGKIPDVPGQMKITDMSDKTFDPDKMSGAEPASPVTVRKLEVIDGKPEKK